MYHVEDHLAAFYFDRAIALFGQALEAAIERAQTGKGKSENHKRMAAQMVLARWLRDDSELGK